MNTENTPPADDVREAAEAGADAKYPMGVSTMGWSYEDAAEYHGRHEGFIEGFLAAAEIRPRGTVTDAEMLRLGKVAWVAHHGNTAWAKSFVEDCFSPAGNLPEEARDMIAVASAVLDAAREARS